jgi:hypothetical protein
MPNRSPIVIEIDIGNLRKCQLPGSYKIPTEPIQVGGEIRVLRAELHKLNNSILNRGELPDHLKESIIIIPIY